MKKYLNSYWYRSAFFTIAQRFSLTLFGFINFIILIRALPKPEMGIWTLFLTIITIFEMTKTNLLKNAHIKFASGTIHNSEKSVIASSSFVINLAITLIFILLILLSANQLHGLTSIGNELGQMLKLYIPSLLLTIFFSHFESIQQSNLDFKGVFAGNFVRQVLFFGFIVTNEISDIPITLMHLVAYQTISIFVGTVTIYFFTRKYLFNLFNPTRLWIKKIIGYGGYIFGSGFVSNIYANVDVLMTAKFMEARHVASYSAANRINALIDIPSYAASEVLFPKVAGASVHEGANRVKYLYERMVAILVTFTTPLALFILIFPEFVITTIAGEQYRDAAFILQLYMITGILRPAQNQAANVLNATGRAKLVFYINSVCLVLNCVINYLCLVRFGFYGPAIGMVVTSVLGCALWYFIMKREIGFEAHNIIKHSVDLSKAGYRFLMNFLIKPKTVAAPETSSRLKIAYIINTDPNDKTSWSGISYYLGQALRRNVGDVDYIWPARCPPLIMNVLLGFVKLNRLLFNKEYKVQYSIVYSWCMTRIVRRQMKGKKYDCIVAPVSSMLIAYLKTDVPIVFFSDCTFNLYSHYYKKEFDRVSPLSLWEGELLERLAFRKSRFVIFTSRWAADSGMNFYGLPENKIAIIPFGANLDHVPDRQIIFEKEKNQVLTLLFLGVDWDRKGGSIAFDAFMNLNNRGIKSKLIICGCIPPEGFSHPLMEVIPFLDKNKKEHQDMFTEILKTSHFLILPTRADCSSIVTCESNAYGIPSIATRTGGVPDLIQDGINGYCLPFEASGENYASLILDIFSNKERFHELILSSRMLYEEKLNWDKWTDDFWLLYDKHIRKDNKQPFLLKPQFN